MAEESRFDALSLCRVLGTLSIASGLALVVAPATMSNVYVLPRRASVLRALGLRDVAIGVAMLSRRFAQAACRMRAGSDAIDAVVIMSEAILGRRSVAAAASRVAGALSIVFAAEKLGRRLRSQPRMQTHAARKPVSMG